MLLNSQIKELNKKTTLFERRVVFLEETKVTSFFVFGACIFRMVKHPELNLINPDGIDR